MPKKVIEKKDRKTVSRTPSQYAKDLWRLRLARGWAKYLANLEEKGKDLNGRKVEGFLGNNVAPAGWDIHAAEREVECALYGRGRTFGVPLEGDPPIPGVEAASPAIHAAKSPAKSPAAVALRAAETQSESEESDEEPGDEPNEEPEGEDDSDKEDGSGAEPQEPEEPEPEEPEPEEPEPEEPEPEEPEAPEPEEPEQPKKGGEQNDEMEVEVMEKAPVRVEAADAPPAAERKMKALELVDDLMVRRKMRRERPLRWRTEGAYVTHCVPCQVKKRRCKGEPGAPCTKCIKHGHPCFQRPRAYAIAKISFTKEAPRGVLVESERAFEPQRYMPDAVAQPEEPEQAEDVAQPEEPEQAEDVAQPEEPEQAEDVEMDEDSHPLPTLTAAELIEAARAAAIKEVVNSAERFLGIDEEYMMVHKAFMEEAPSEYVRRRTVPDIDSLNDLGVDMWIY